MPRLTNNDFLARHYFLKRLWEDANLQNLYTVLAPLEQLDLHQYFQTINPGDERAVLETRTTVNAGDRSLPQRAGRAYSILFERFQYVALPHVVRTPTDALPIMEEVGVAYRAVLMGASRPAGNRKVRQGAHQIGAIMKPNIDWSAYARTFLMLAQHLNKEEAKANASKPGATDTPELKQSK